MWYLHLFPFESFKKVYLYAGDERSNGTHQWIRYIRENDESENTNEEGAEEGCRHVETEIVLLRKKLLTYMGTH